MNDHKNLLLLVLFVFFAGCGGAQSNGQTVAATDEPDPGPDGPSDQDSQQDAPEPAFLSWSLEHCALGPITDASASQSQDAFAQSVGHDVETESYEAEGDSYERYIVRWGDDIALVAESGTYFVRTPSIEGPGGLRVGRSGEDVFPAMAGQIDCLRGTDDSEGHVLCVAPDAQSIMFIFENVPVQGDCVSDCGVPPQHLQSETIDELRFFPCQ